MGKFYQIILVVLNLKNILTVSAILSKKTTGISPQIDTICSLNALNFFSASAVYFKDNHVIAIIDATDNDLPNGFKCFNGNQFRPVLLRKGM
jgi:hypothetical protein